MIMKISWKTKLSHLCLTNDLIRTHCSWPLILRNRSSLRMLSLMMNHNTKNRKLSTSTSNKITVVLDQSGEKNSTINRSMDGMTERPAIHKK